MLRVSLLHRDLGHRFADPGELERPEQWTGEWVRHRMVEAFTIERHIPDKRVGPAIVEGAWASIPTTDTFAERVDQGELARNTCGKSGRAQAGRCLMKFPGWRKRCPGPAWF
jgi:hypothetical protein